MGFSRRCSPTCVSQGLVCNVGDVLMPCPHFIFRHLYIYTHTYTHTHTHTHTHKHTHTHTHTHTQTHTHSRTHIRTHTNTHKHTRTPTFHHATPVHVVPTLAPGCGTHSPVYACLRVCMFVRVCVHAVCAYMHVCMLVLDVRVCVHVCVC
jgi:hypothetical protein